MEPTKKTTTNSHCPAFRQTERNTSMAKLVNLTTAVQGHRLKVLLRFIFTSIVCDDAKYWNNNVHKYCYTLCYIKVQCVLEIFSWLCSSAENVYYNTSTGEHTDVSSDRCYYNMSPNKMKPETTMEILA